GLPHNSRRINEVGIDVDNLVGLGRIKPGTLNDVMVAGLLTSQAWVDIQTYNTVSNHAILRCGSAPGNGGGDYLFVSGVIDRADHVSLSPTYRLTGPTDYTAPDPQGQYVLQIETAQGGVQQIPFKAVFDATDSATESDSAAFSLVLPAD